MRFIHGMFIGSTLATLIGIGMSHASTSRMRDMVTTAEHNVITAEHKAIIATWEKEQAEKKASDLQMLLDTLRRAERDPVNLKGQAVPAGDLIPAPAVPFPTAPAAASKSNE